MSDQTTRFVSYSILVEDPRGGGGIPSNANQLPTYQEAKQLQPQIQQQFPNHRVVVVGWLTPEEKELVGYDFQELD